MKVLPVCFYQLNSKKKFSNGSVQFEHHPDFIKLRREYDIDASSYFRRGESYGTYSDEFSDVLQSLKLFFNKRIHISSNNKIKMLIGGIGKSQEPFSILATIKSLIIKKEIHSVLDLYTVDLQSKPDHDTLFRQSFYDNRQLSYVTSSFVKDDGTKYGLKTWQNRRVNDEIFKYLLRVYNNPNKSAWETRLQDKIKTYPDKYFNIISVNNTIGYIINEKQKSETIENIERTLKPEGIFITDPYRDCSNIFTKDIADKIYDGIYQKKKQPLIFSL